MTSDPIDSAFSDFSIEDTEVLQDSEAFSLIHCQTDDKHPLMTDNGFRSARTFLHQEDIRCYDERILELQQGIDRDNELIRHLVASKAVAVEHEKALCKIDEEYGDPKGRERILERIGGGGENVKTEQNGEARGSSRGRVGSFRNGIGSTRSTRSGKETTKEREGVKEPKKEKPKLILYEKRGMAKRDPKKQEDVKPTDARRLTYNG